LLVPATDAMTFLAEALGENDLASAEISTESPFYLLRTLRVVAAERIMG